MMIGRGTWMGRTREAASGVRRGPVMACPARQAVAPGVAVSALALTMTLLALSPALGQSSSLYLQGPQAQPPAPARQDQDDAQPRPRLEPALAQVSFASVSVPEPRRLGMHDLVTIVIRESMETDFRSSLSTSRDVDFDGQISDFPRLTWADMVNAQLRPNTFGEGQPRVGIDYSQSFDGDGDYRRSESITGRVTARVIDVKPNGTVVLEARKHLEADDETLTLVLTGTARAEDITADNTILSTQLYDLRLNKQHTGELRRSSRKGIFTRILETVFNF